MKIRPPYLIVAILIWSVSFSTYSEEENSYLRQNEDPEDYSIDEILTPYEEDFFSFLNTPHEIISEGVEIMAQGMDLFFADENVYDEASSSYARLSTRINFSHGGESSISGDIRLKIDLKKTKKKLKLLLESDTDRDMQTGTDTSKFPAQTNEPVNFYAALQKEISQRNEWRAKASLGLKIKVPLDPFLRVRTHKNFSLGKGNMRFTETLFWFNSKGAGLSSLLDINYPLTKDLLFRSRTSALWTDFLDYHEFEHSFTLYHELTDRRAISYSIGSYGISEPHTHAIRYYTHVGYRQRIHKDWLFIEVSPAISFERSNEFQLERSLILKLEMVFGNKYVYHPEDD